MTDDHPMSDKDGWIRCECGGEWTEHFLCKRCGGDRDPANAPSDKQDVVDKLRRKALLAPPFGSASLTHDGKFTCEMLDDGYRYVNPDGPAAADEIIRLRTLLSEQDSKLAEARKALGPFSKYRPVQIGIANLDDCGTVQIICNSAAGEHPRFAHFEAVSQALANLGSEDDGR